MGGRARMYVHALVPSKAPQLVYLSAALGSRVHGFLGPAARAALAHGELPGRWVRVVVILVLPIEYETI